MALFDNDGLLYLWQRLKTMFADKVDKVDGKGLSSNDYTTGEKTKLTGIEEGANKTTVENVLTSTSTTNALSAAQGKVLKDALDQKAENTDMTGATSAAAGTHGLVPAPAAGDQGKFL